MSAIFKREFKSYFTTPIGYIVLTIFYFFLGISFTDYYGGGVPDMSSILLNSLLMMVVIITLPVLTMRLMSEDRKQKVDQALLTAPVKLVSIVLGKFFAAFAVFAIGFAPTVIFEIVFCTKVGVNIYSIFSYVYSLLGVLLLGGAIITIGMFISSLTESTAISAILSLVINIVVLILPNLAGLIPTPTSTTAFGTFMANMVNGLISVLESLAFINRTVSFSDNIFSIADVAYFLSIIAVFIFLSVRSLEKRRWS